ncbi:DUF4870 domain-containing protein [Microbacterium sp. NPDC076911]|uniref:DUF4870 domain-containing protein n=1 Tax=Microbacterium sp. NPDC076911 TaxID=3154958 RepID=UPI003441B6CC
MSTPSPYVPPQPPPGSPRAGYTQPAYSPPVQSSDMQSPDVQQPAYAAAHPSMSPDDEKMWATLTHLGALFFGWIVPLIAFLMMKDRGPFVREHTAAALNFQLTMVIGYIIGVLLIIALVGFVILIALPVLNLVFCIVAAVKANRGEWYTYPLTIRFVS